LAPDLAGGLLAAILHTPELDLRDPTFKGRGGQQKGKERRRKG